jgi:hypothetical protein
LDLVEVANLETRFFQIRGIYIWHFSSDVSVDETKKSKGNIILDHGFFMPLLSSLAQSQVLVTTSQEVKIKFILINAFGNY